MYLIDMRYSQQEHTRLEDSQMMVTGAGAKDLTADAEQVFFKETPYNDFTERLSNWIADRLGDDTLVDYGTTNLMQNRYELRCFLEKNAKRHAQWLEEMAAEAAAAGKKNDEDESSSSEEEKSEDDGDEKSDEDSDEVESPIKQ
jgi:hypothetical protein